MNTILKNAMMAGALVLLGAGTAGAQAQQHPIPQHRPHLQPRQHQHHVIHEPRLVPMVSSKTEKAWTRCQLCDSLVSYERTYRRDPYQSAWIETTQSVPTYCRSCAAKQPHIEKLLREEAKLDRKIEERNLKARIAAKRQYLRETAGTN